jgi:phospholipid-binding lipoprotein MlaA
VTRFLLRATALLAVVAVSGCATSPDADPRDPLEPMNRAIYNFNDSFDEAIATPVAKAYRSVLHVEIRNRISNFWSNIGDVFIGVNNVLQGKFQDGIEDWARVAFNSTIGLFGIHDVASDMGIEKHDEDFGQTFGRWGIGPGPYLMIPFIGPSTLRDGTGLVLDFHFDPWNDVTPSSFRDPMWGLRLVNRRAELLVASSLLEQAALDRYIFLRDAYLQRRRNQVYDGQPPRQRDEDVNEPPKPAVK